MWLEARLHSSNVSGCSPFKERFTFSAFWPLIKYSIGFTFSEFSPCGASSPVHLRCCCTKHLHLLRVRCAFAFATSYMSNEVLLTALSCGSADGTRSPSRRPREYLAARISQGAFGGSVWGPGRGCAYRGRPGAGQEPLGHVLGPKM